MTAVGDLIRARKEAKKTLEDIARRAENVYVVHYACESFRSNPGRTPRITAIVVRNLRSRESESFSFLDQDPKLPADDREKHLLKKFASFVGIHSGSIWLQWNSIDYKFGFRAIQTRCESHKPRVTLPELKESYGVARILENLQGQDFLKADFACRLHRLAELNGFTSRGLLHGVEEPEEHAKGNYATVRDSVECKVGIICNALERWRDGTLKTDARLLNKFGGVRVIAVQYGLKLVLPIVSFAATIIRIFFWRA